MRSKLRYLSSTSLSLALLAPSIGFAQSPKASSPPPTSGACTAPGPAAAAGYTQMTYGPSLKLGQNIQPVTGDAASSGVTQNSDGSVTIRGGDANHYNDQINTGDMQFGGGAYIQANLSFQNPPAGWSPGSPGWPAFWGTSTSEGPHVEADFFEFMTQGDSQKFDFGMQDWQSSTSVTWSGDGGYGHPSAVNLPAGFDPSQPHDYGFLWIPASGNSQGSAQMYVDGQAMGPVYNWDQGGGPWSSMDSNRLQVILGTGPDNPMTVNSLQIWQGPGADNTGSPQPSGGSCTAPTVPASTSPIALKPPSKPNNNTLSLAPFADNNCPGLTFLDDFSGGISKWRAGNSGSANAAGIISLENDPAATIAAAPGHLGMSVVAGGPSGFKGAWLDTKDKFSQLFGYYEATVDVPEGTGLTGAFWLTGANTWPPEIDIAESDGKQMTSALHSAATSDTSAYYEPLKPGKHVYAVDWNKDKITWYEDAAITHEAATPADLKSQPMIVVLDMMATGPLDYRGTPAPGTSATMTVSQVRVFKDIASALACVPQVSASTAPLPNSTTPLFSAPAPANLGTNSPITTIASPQLPADLQSQITQAEQQLNQTTQQTSGSRLTGPAAARVAHQPAVQQMNAVNQELGQAMQSLQDAESQQTLGKLGKDNDQDEASDNDDKDD